jgi:hypothetical protein
MGKGCPNLRVKLTVAMFFSFAFLVGSAQTTLLFVGEVKNQLSENFSRKKIYFWGETNSDKISTSSVHTC